MARPSLPGSRPTTECEALSDVSPVLLLIGAAAVSIALFNKVPRYVPGRLPAPRDGSAPSGSVATGGRAGTRPRVRLASARLTEQGRALLTAVGGSTLIVAFFLTLSGL